MNIKKKTISISGMSCINCQNRIEKALKKAKGIKEAAVSYEKGTAEISYDADRISLQEIETVIRAAGYEVRKSTAVDTGAGRTASFTVLILALFVLLQRSGILNVLAPGQLADTGMGYGMLFIIGLLTSVHCVAMCGGINLSQCIGNGEQTSFLAAALYNLGRVISYTCIGFVLGLFGMLAGGNGNVGIPVVLQGILKLIAGALMVIMGINMLNLFPYLRRFTLHMPQGFAKKINSKKAGRGAFAVGLLNGLMPCGPLQSMQLVALASGSPIAGAVSMLMFSLGTVPLMLGLGSAVTLLGRRFAGKAMTAGAVLVVVLGLAMISQGGSLTGFPYVLMQETNVANNAADGLASDNNKASALADGSAAADSTDGDKAGASTGAAVVQEIHSTLTGRQYPQITVKAGVPVKWVIDVPEHTLNGCNYKMILSAFGIEHTFTEGENVIEFTPTTTGDIKYSCWMGMIRGDILVTDADADNAAQQFETETDAQQEEYAFPLGGCCGA